MTAGKVLIDGTAYDIKGGKTLIDGTAYDIKGGKTLIGGTACDISFAPPREQTMQALLQDVTVKSNVGRNASSTSSITLSFNAAFPYPLYVLSFCNGYMSVNKVTWDGSSFTKTIIHQDSTSYGNIYTDNTNKRIRYSNNGSSSTSVRAATLLALSLNNYTTSEADSIFSSATYTRFAGRNSSSTGTVYEFIGCWLQINTPVVLNRHKFTLELSTYKQFVHTLDTRFNVAWHTATLNRDRITLNLVTEIVVFSLVLVDVALRPYVF